MNAASILFRIVRLTNKRSIVCAIAAVCAIGLSAPPTYAQSGGNAGGRGAGSPAGAAAGARGGISPSAVRSQGVGRPNPSGGAATGAGAAGRQQTQPGAGQQNAVQPGGMGGQTAPNAFNGNPSNNNANFPRLQMPHELVPQQPQSPQTPGANVQQPGAGFGSGQGGPASSNAPNFRSPQALEGASINRGGPRINQGIRPPNQTIQPYSNAPNARSPQAYEGGSINRGGPRIGQGIAAQENEAEQPYSDAPIARSPQAYQGSSADNRGPRPAGGGNEPAANENADLYFDRGDNVGANRYLRSSQRPGTAHRETDPSGANSSSFDTRFEYGAAQLDETLGVRFDTENRRTVNDVRADSFAYRAGLREGDRIMAVGNSPSESMDELTAAAQTEGRLSMLVERDGAQRWLSVDFTNRQRAFLGVGTQRNHGAVRVYRVFEGTPAANAGLQANDKILSVNGEPVRSHNDFAHRVEAAAENQGRLSLEVDRDGQLRTVEAHLQTDATLR